MPGFFNERQQIEAKRAAVEEFDVRWIPKGFLQKRNSVHPHTLIGIQRIPDAENEISAHRGHVLLRVTFNPVETLPTSFPSTSIIWMAQAMQGSNEWTVRRISSGHSGFASF